MALPAPADDLNTQRRAFMKLHDLHEQLTTKGFRLDTLSMGTTNDMQTAIAEGATIVRIRHSIIRTQVPLSAVALKVPTLTVMILIL